LGVLRKLIAGVRDMRNHDAPLLLGPWSQLVVTLMKVKGGANTSLGSTMEIAEIAKRLLNRRLVTAGGHMKEGA
jgi:hypothetical protein